MNNIMLFVCFFTFILTSTAWTQDVTELKPGKVNCIDKKRVILAPYPCHHEQIVWKLYETLHRSKRPNSGDELVKLVVGRARKFLAQKKYDYLSVAALMIFPIPQKEEILKEFLEMPGVRAPLTQIALDRIKVRNISSEKKKDSPLPTACHDKDLKPFVG